MALRSKPSPPPERPAPGTDSLIAAGMVLNGDCRTEGALRVDGHVTGNVRARRVMVGPGGRVDGDVTGPDSDGEQAVVIEGMVGGAVRAPRVEIGRGGAVGGGMEVKEAVVRGRVAGAIVTERRLMLEETAVVEGDVTAPRLGLKEGGQVFGTIRIGRAPREDEFKGGDRSRRKQETGGGGQAAGAQERGGEPAA